MGAFVRRSGELFKERGNGRSRLTTLGACCCPRLCHEGPQFPYRPKLDSRQGSISTISFVPRELPASKGND
jgi:hypothetical protein